MKHLFLRFMLPIWVIVIGGLFVWNCKLIHRNNLERVRGELQFFVKQIKIARTWNASHGGVYVPVTETTQPNKYLKDPERDVVTVDGLKLTKINPAFMTRQMSELQEQQYEIRSHITSLDSIRPANEPDDWEKTALLAFEKGVAEEFDLTEVGPKRMFRYMMPLITEKSCLKCHAHQGYEEGDIRGGISVLIPAKDSLERMRGEYAVAGVVYPSICLIGLLGVGFYIRFKQSEESNREISKKIEVLHDENTTKGAFLSMISHDLRTPFNGIIGIADMAIESVKENKKDEAVEMLELISESSKEGYALLDNLLQWSRLQAGQIIPRPEALLLKEIENEVRNLLAGNLKLKGIDYRSNILGASEIFADGNVIYTVLRNLISNAIKFTPEGGRIEVSAWCENEITKLTVKDNGIGMSEDAIHQIFDACCVFSSPGTNNEVGTGLGLLLCRNLIELNNGELLVDSNVGAGTQVTIVLPNTCGKNEKAVPRT